MHVCIYNIYRIAGNFQGTSRFSWILTYHQKYKPQINCGFKIILVKELVPQKFICEKLERGNNYCRKFCPLKISIQYIYNYVCMYICMYVCM